MCYSATASFVASGVIGTIGLATLRHVREPRALLFAAVPMLFSLHQFTEGFVWLGLEGRVGPVALGHVTFLFMIYAQGLLPFLMPLAIRLMEPPGWRQKAITALTVLGAFVCAWMIYGLIFFESQCFVEKHSIAGADVREDFGFGDGNVIRLNRDIEKGEPNHVADPQGPFLRDSHPQLRPR